MKTYTNTNSFGSHLILYYEILLRSLTWKKALNLFKSGVGYICGSDKLSSRPPIIKLATTNLCNLHCPACSTGMGTPEQKKLFMSPESFHKILKESQDSALIGLMYHKGEPFLNENLLDMCDTASKKGVSPIVSTNFSINFKDSDFEKIVTSGISYINISIDGITQDTYEKYRVGGELTKVLSNAKKLIKSKKKLNSNTPIVAWQFIDFDHNDHQRDQAEQMAKSLGFDQFVIRRDNAENFCDNYIMGADFDGNLKSDRFPFKCKWPWFSTLFLHQGGVKPCCYYPWSKESNLGSVEDKPFEEIWNGQEYQANRQLVTNKIKRGEVSSDTHCLYCPIESGI